jgi:hypothetical protein
MADIIQPAGDGIRHALKDPSALRSHPAPLRGAFFAPQGRRSKFDIVSQRMIRSASTQRGDSLNRAAIAPCRTTFDRQSLAGEAAVAQFACMQAVNPFPSSRPGRASVH